GQRVGGPKNSPTARGKRSSSAERNATRLLRSWHIRRGPALLHDRKRCDTCRINWFSYNCLRQEGRCLQLLRGGRMLGCIRGCTVGFRENNGGNCFAGCGRCFDRVRRLLRRRSRYVVAERIKGGQFL